MHEVARKLEQIVSEMSERLRAVPEAETEARPAPGKWSKKEILGHLVDSAANNHQRFVRAQLEPHISIPGYAQDSWVGSQQYQEEGWENLVQLWASYNRHLRHVILRIPPAKLANTCAVGNSEPVTLEFLISDYVRHLEHHLKQMLD